jgi:peptidoglycan hydrolase CwlO-like protein
MALQHDIQKFNTEVKRLRSQVEQLQTENEQLKKELASFEKLYEKALEKIASQNEWIMKFRRISNE